MTKWIENVNFSHKENGGDCKVQRLENDMYIFLFFWPDTVEAYF